MVRFIFVFLLFSSSIIDTHAKTITFFHDEDIEVKFQDAVHPQILDYAPKFVYPTSTIFQLAESRVHFYTVSFSEKEYYLWIEDSSTNIEIDLSNPKVNSLNVKLISKSEWYSAKVDLNNSALEELNEIDLYYANALDSLNRLTQTDDQFRAAKDYNSIVWNSRSARNLYNLAVEKFSHQVDENWINFIPAYTQYWQLMYKLYYQNYRVNSFKGLIKKEIKSTIETHFNNPESQLLVFEHFFREGLTVTELKENYEFLRSDLDLKQKDLAEAFIQRQAVKDVSRTQKIDFLFGIDIDGSMEGYFARDSSEKKHLLVFWSTWDRNMATEFNLLADLKKNFKERYNFIHICIDAYETPDKTKSFIYQNRVGGFHLLPEQSSAFRKSNFKKDQKIRDFPFYVLTDNSGKVIETESVPLEISNRLESKLKHFSTKK